MQTVNEHADKFNITLEEFIQHLTDLLDDLFSEGLSPQDGTLLAGAGLFLSTLANETCVESYCRSYLVWGDCYLREVQFLLKDFGSLLDLGFDFNFNQWQHPVRMYLEAEEKGEDFVVTAEDVDMLFDFMVALSRHACRYVAFKRLTQGSYFPEFPLEDYQKKFSIN